MKRLLLPALCYLLSLSVLASPRGVTLRYDAADNFSSTAAGILDRVASETGISVPAMLVHGAKSLKINLVNSSDPALAEDGYIISRQGRNVTVTGKDKGVVYGVCGLLKDYAGIDYWGEGEYFVSDHAPHLPEGTFRSEPSFSYRQTQGYMLSDPLYKWWYRLEEPYEEFVDNLWVHTCNHLLPASVYGESHPEYYAWYGGERHPGSASQWCLSNPEVLEIVCGRLDFLFKANPGLNTISISQNDGSDTYCRCPECQAAMDEEGGPSGPILRFINAVAERFPDKTISTLAYLFSVNPPARTVPRENVSIMLCDIDCRRQTALTENPSGREFMKALEGWSRVCDKLFVWDYGINFDNYLSPFPNFSTMGYNMRIFKDHNVKMHFSQIASVRGGDMAELRTYLASNLMWDAGADADSLVRHFLGAYYGEAADPLYRYLRVMEGAAVGTDLDLFIYDSPVSYKGNILRPALLKRYNEYFNEAERRVGDDPVRLARVRRSRLPLRYSALEIARTDPDMDRTKAAADLDLFASECERFGVEMINERHNTPAEYVSIFRDRYLSPQTSNFARGKKVSYISAPDRKYASLGETALTDGVYGGTTYVESWVGWEGRDASFVVDLEELRPVSSVSCDFLHQIGAWILLPLSVSYSFSADGKDWSSPSVVSLAEKRSGKVEFIPVEWNCGGAPVSARFVRVDVCGTKVCPPWHYGVGNPSWFFIDEVIVR